MPFTLRGVHPKHAVSLLGLLCFGLGVVHLVTEGEGFGTVLEAFIICSISLLVFDTAYRLPTRPVSRSGQWQIVWIAVGVMVSFASLAFAIWLIWVLEGDASDLFFLVAFATTLGAAVGTRGGLYAIESEERLSEAEDLTKLLTINQRVLRHNLRNELSVALGYLKNIEDADAAEDTSPDVRTIETHLTRLLRTSDRTREIVSIWENDYTESFALTSVLDEQITQIEEAYPSVKITRQFDDDCRVNAHPALPRAMKESLKNAIEHTPGEVPITASVYENEAGMAVVEITDVGEGIPKFDVEAIESTAETPLQHTQGLGLWIIYWTVEMSNGTLELLEASPRGTTVRITLPLAK